MLLPLLFLIRVLPLSLLFPSFLLFLLFLFFCSFTSLFVLDVLFCSQVDDACCVIVCEWFSLSGSRPTSAVTAVAGFKALPDRLLIIRQCAQDTIAMFSGGKQQRGLQRELTLTEGMRQPEEREPEVYGFNLGAQLRCFVPSNLSSIRVCVCCLRRLRGNEALTSQPEFFHSSGILSSMYSFATTYCWF